MLGNKMISFVLNVAKIYILIICINSTAWFTQVLYNSKSFGSEPHPQSDPTHKHRANSHSNSY